jgi:uncharacterized protein
VIEECWTRPNYQITRRPDRQIPVWYIDEFMLSLNLARIRTAQERFEFVYQPEAFPDKGESVGVVAPIKLAFDIYKDKDQFRLVGGVQTTLELMCSRCLEPFTLPIDASFDLRYHPHALNTGEGEREVEEDDLTTAFYENEAIDLGQLMAEQFYLALPMKPLCREGCKGLCPACGTNLNRATCICKRGWEDPRFAVLKKLIADS